MAWTSVTRGSTHHIKLCKDEQGEQLVLGLVQSGLSHSSQGTRKRHQQNMLSQKDEMADDDDVGDDLANPAEKKRRLTVDQVKFLEMSFNMDLKLEPERKALIAKQLGLRPRQVAIWFQNRRARWKNKQLEQDYEALKEKYEAAVKENNSMLKQNEAMLEENKRLQAEVAQLKALIDIGAAGVKSSPDSDSDVESGSREQKSELASPAKSDDHSGMQDFGSYSCLMTAGAMVDPPITEMITCTSVKFESEEHRPLSPLEEVFGLFNNPLLFQQIMTGYQFHQMEDLYSSWDDHAYGWVGQWDS